MYNRMYIVFVPRGENRIVQKSRPDGELSPKNDDTNFVLELSARKFERDSISRVIHFFYHKLFLMCKIRDTFLI
jgi:hypothetical protein